MNLQKRPWHDLYEMLSGSAEVKMLQMLEPTEFSTNDEWAIKLRQQFPTVPPSGVEMCHKNWLVGLDIILDSISEQKYHRENFWCGNIPLEIISGLGLRRRVLQFWLKNVPQNEVVELFAKTTGESPFIAAIYYRILGESKDASFEIKADLQNIVDLLVGPFVNAQEAIAAKWRIMQDQQIKRSSILQNLDESVITCLCNYRTLTNIDSLIKMIAKQKLQNENLGGCNTSLQFMMQEAPEVLLASNAIVWACYLFVASELGQASKNIQSEKDNTKSYQDESKNLTPPEIIKDQVLSIIDKLGNSNPVKRWLVASLGLVVKAWLKRTWAFIGIQVDNSALPNFVFQLPDTLLSKSKRKIRKAPKVKSSETSTTSNNLVSSNIAKKLSPAPVPQTALSNPEISENSDQNDTNSTTNFQNTPDFLSLEQLEKLVENENKDLKIDTIAGRMTGFWAQKNIAKKLTDAQNNTESKITEKTKEIKPEISNPTQISHPESSAKNFNEQPIQADNLASVENDITEKHKANSKKDTTTKFAEPVSNLEDLNLSDQYHVYTEIMQTSDFLDSNQDNAENKPNEENKTLDNNENPDTEIKPDSSE